ncbi:hypothetical protein BDP27DRAFT_1347384 [Rhodocollybia butyracea]|uniref:NACHT domain-containing protein n=1 Tax=Rhodocollybia butyracea TaxID=206335 RepID=A0A9P5TWP3_9AGAR|nr:hypothetical protein BDP27DRAFT_1347384 [Rhodocollybia butyracea]
MSSLPQSHEPQHYWDSHHDDSLKYPHAFPQSMPSFFPQSHNFQVFHGQFINVAGDVNIEKARSSNFVQRSESGNVRYAPYSHGPSVRPLGQPTLHASSSRLLEEPRNPGTLMTSDVTTFDGTPFPQEFLQSQLSGSTVALYPGPRQFLSLPIIDSDVHSMDHTMLNTQNAPSYFDRESSLSFTLSEEFWNRGESNVYSVPPNSNQPTTTINDCTFVSHTRQLQGERGIDKLHNVAALEALHDSADSFPQPRCHPETRTKMLEDLRKWSLETDPTSTSILWLFGPAGAGKSAIIRTLSNQLQSDGRLGGCFFFKRGHSTRGNAKVLFVTIAYQLAIHVPWLKGPISQVVEADPSVVARSIETQLRMLISEPCRMRPNENPLMILIDGLDECQDQSVHLEILRAIRNSFTGHPLPLRFIIASRPEAHIQEMFESSAYQGVYQPFNVWESFDDIRKYLLDEFARIHCEHRQTMSTIPLPWPVPKVLDKLVSRSSGYFIYASTIIKFVDDKNYRPTERLAIVMQDQIESESPFDILDQLYINILSTVPISKHHKLIQILCALVNFDITAHDVDQLLGLEIGDTRLFLRSLHSIIDAPLFHHHHFFTNQHASFYDFLRDPKRSQDFYVGVHHMDLARSMLRFLAHVYDQKHWDDFQYYLNKLLLFIASLPPSVELLPLIENAIIPEYIYYFDENFPVDHMLAWIKEIHPVPEHHIQLWENYEYMEFMVYELLLNSRREAMGLIKMSSSSTHAILTQSPGFLHFIHLVVLLQTVSESTSITTIHQLLGVSWSDLLSNISCLRSIIGKDEELWENLRNHVLGLSFAGESFPWPSFSRDLAHRCIQIGNDIHAGKLTDKRWETITHYWRTIQHYWCIFLRSSPSCNELLHDIQSLHPSQLPRCSAWEKYHVLMWLKVRVQNIGTEVKDYLDPFFFLITVIS